MENVED